MSRLDRVVAVALFLQFTLGVVGLAIAAPPADLSAAIEVTVANGELTVDVRNTPLDQVLGLVGERAGIEVTLRGDLSAPITQAFAGLPFEEGIRQLAHGQSVAVAYGTSVEGSAPARVTKIWVMGKPSSGAEASSPSRALSMESGAPSLKQEHAGAGVADASGESPMASRIGEIQTFADDADRGSEAAMMRLAEIAASDADAGFRQQAVAALARIKDPLVEQALTVALEDAEASVRVRAVRGLRGTGTDTAVATLARASTGDADPEVRFAALSALMSFPGHTMVQGLVRAVADPDGRVRDAAARGLTWWENARRSSAP
jgi:HEAT repeat protein